MRAEVYINTTTPTTTATRAPQINNMALTVKKNLGCLTGREENIQEEPTMFRTKAKRTKTLQRKEEEAKRKALEVQVEETKRKFFEEVSELSKRVRKTSEVEEQREPEKASSGTKMVKLSMKNLRPKMELVEVPLVKREVDDRQVKKENVQLFGFASKSKQIETIVLF